MANVLLLRYLKKYIYIFLAVIQKGRSCVLQYSSENTKALIYTLYTAITQKTVTMTVF